MKRRNVRRRQAKRWWWRYAATQYRMDWNKYYYVRWNGKYVRCEGVSAFRPPKSIWKYDL